MKAFLLSYPPHLYRLFGDDGIRPREGSRHIIEGLLALAIGPPHPDQVSLDPSPGRDLEQVVL